MTFTLTGPGGSAHKTIDTGLANRMEAGDRNYVTLQSPNLGPLKSISVKRDDAGLGPAWDLSWIRIQSALYGVNKQVNFDCTIEGMSPVTRGIL